MNYKKITKCRICGNTKLSKIGSLGMIAASDFTDYPSKGTKMPLELIFCSKCTLLQLGHNYNRSLLYNHYWYRSALNPMIVADLKEIAKYANGKFIHFDIGGNDGTLLKYSKAEVKVCIDPSDIFPTNINAWVNKYFEDVLLPYKADIITAIACLYDLPDPAKFITNVKRHLQDDGVFISQFQPLHEMIELNDVGNICHEHLEYYSYKSLVYLFEKNGLEIYKVEKNTMNGGSYRLFAKHYTQKSVKFLEKEYKVADLKDFFKRIEKNKENFWYFAQESQPTIYGYGASTKANTILQYYGIKNLTIVDINPDKLCKYPITSSMEIVNKIPANCDYLWVFPYGFLDFFKTKEKKYKGKWLTTIPEFKIS